MKFRNRQNWSRVMVVRVVVILGMQESVWG